MSNYFDAYEAVDELIDDVNTEYYEECYDSIYGELCRRVEEGELSLEDAEILNDAAANKYLVEKCGKGCKEPKKEMEPNAERRKNLKKATIGVGATGAVVGTGIAAHITGVDKKAVAGMKSIASTAREHLPKLKKKPNGGKVGDAALK